MHMFTRCNFFSGKINYYIEEFDANPTGKGGGSGLDEKVNRLQGFAAAVIRTTKYPLGYGLIQIDEQDDRNYVYGTNGLWLFVRFLGDIFISSDHIL